MSPALCGCHGDTKARLDAQSKPLMWGLYPLKGNLWLEDWSPVLLAVMGQSNFHGVLNAQAGGLWACPPCPRRALGADLIRGEPGRGAPHASVDHAVGRPWVHAFLGADRACAVYGPLGLPCGVQGVVSSKQVGGCWVTSQLMMCTREGCGKGADFLRRARFHWFRFPAPVSRCHCQVPSPTKIGRRARLSQVAEYPSSATPVPAATLCVRPPAFTHSSTHSSSFCASH